MNNFEELRKEMLSCTCIAEDCMDLYNKLNSSKSLEDLCNAIKDNFYWCCRQDVVNGALIDKYKDEFAANGIYHNTSVENGFLLVTGNTRVTAEGNSTVFSTDDSVVESYDRTYTYACCNSTVNAFRYSIVKAFDHSTVNAYEYTRVEARDNTTVHGHDDSFTLCTSKVNRTLEDYAILRLTDCDVAQYACKDLKFKKLR